MIKDGDVIPGNMYFTTTKLHQEMAGGKFADIIAVNGSPLENIQELLEVGFDKVMEEYKKNCSLIGEEVSVKQVDGTQKGKVVDVVEKGYMLKDKVIRYAKVVIGE